MEVFVANIDSKYIKTAVLNYVVQSLEDLNSSRLSSWLFLTLEFSSEGYNFPPFEVCESLKSIFYCLERFILGDEWIIWKCLLKQPEWYPSDLEDIVICVDD